MKKKKTKIIAGLIVLVVIIFGVYSLFFKKEKVDYSLVKASKGNVVQTVSETGAVKKGEEIKLGFKSSGEIEKIYVATGSKVKSGDLLAKIDTTQLNIQSAQAKASLDVVQAQYDKLLAGASPQEITIAQTTVENAQISLQSAEQKLEDTEASAQESIANYYESALNVLDDAYLKIENSYNTVQVVQRTYFTTTEQESILVSDNKDSINNFLLQLKTPLVKAKNTSVNEDIDVALSRAKTTLSGVANNLKIVRDVCETIKYQSVVSSTDKTLLDTHRGYINTALTSVISSQQTISSTKITNEANINVVQAQVSAAKGTLKAAQDQLTKLKAPPRQEDVDLYQAQVKQAQAQVNLLQTQIGDTSLKSPTNGTITDVSKKEGEIVQSLMDFVILLIPDDPYQIDVDIYEEDIVKLAINNEVEISLVAFPDTVFRGKVISIDPTQKLKEGVVYYNVVVGFEGEIPETIKPGMTADLVIHTASRENVLTIPKGAVQENGKVTVEILNGKEIQQKEIKTGLKGSDDLVEIVSGLKEGEEVIVR